MTATRCALCQKSHLTERCPSRVTAASWKRTVRRSQRRGARSATLASASAKRARKAAALLLLLTGCAATRPAAETVATWKAAHPSAFTIPRPEIAAALASSPDSIVYTWSLPRFGAWPRSGDPDSSKALHSPMTSEVWLLPQFSPGWPVQWFPVRLAVLPAAPPGAALGIKVPSRFGTAWVIAIGPGGVSFASNLVPGRLAP